MRWVMFYHSLCSDWNHGNAHFLRGIVSELIDRGENVEVYEPVDGWSRTNLVQEHGLAAVDGYKAAYPELTSHLYSSDDIDLDVCLDGADVVIAHEWNDTSLIQRLGEHRRRCRSYKLLFHDTHHRIATAPDQMRQYDLTHFDGVLAFGNVISELYETRGLHDRIRTWHEAADVRRFRPLPERPREGDLVWIGNWGDDERTEELQDFLLDPIHRLRLDARIYGVRYPAEACAAVAAAGADYHGWLPNYRVPDAFARFRVTAHVPRRPYTEMLPGIPTIRVFEALACGIPLVSSPWADTEHLFRPGEDYLIARSGAEMEDHLRQILNEQELARSLTRKGLESILERHTCKHRVDELLEFLGELGLNLSEAKDHADDEPVGQAAPAQSTAATS